MAEIPTSPGSYNEFVKRNGLQGDSKKALAEHSAATAQYRDDLAESLGMSLYELHTSSLSTLATRLGELSLAETA